MKLRNWNIGVCKLFMFFMLFGFSCKTKQSISAMQNLPYKSFCLQQQNLKLPNGHHIKYIDAGDTNALNVILLVHGVPTSAWMFRHLIQKLADSGYRVIAPDMLGYGQSDKPKGYDIYAPKAMGGYLLVLMKSLKIAKWTHLCHDAGGLWTWEMLKQNANGVDKLILLNTIIFQEGFDPPMEMKKNFISKAYVKTYTMGLSRKGTMKATLSNGLYNKDICTPEMLAGYIKPSEERLDYALFQFFSNVCVKKLPDYEPLLNSLNIPAKVIWGMQDKILMLEPQEDKLSKSLNLKVGDVLKLQKAKHFIAEEQPQAIVDFILK